MNNYVKPTLEIVDFDTVDIIMTSVFLPNPGDYDSGEQQKSASTTQTQTNSFYI